MIVIQKLPYKEKYIDADKGGIFQYLYFQLSTKKKKKKLLEAWKHKWKYTVTNGGLGICSHLCRDHKLFTETLITHQSLAHMDIFSLSVRVLRKRF